MKKKMILFLPIYLFVLLFGIKVNALTGTTALNETITSTEKDTYITLKHTINESTNKISMSYEYDSNYLQLVGFLPVSSIHCSLSENIITCGDISDTIPNNTVIVYPVFKIKTTLNANKDIKTTFTDEVQIQNITTTTVTKVNQNIEVTAIDIENSTNSLTINETLQLEATVSPENATDKTITYTSSDTSIATVNEKGLITAISSGTTNITLTSGKITKTILITVKDEVIELEDIITTEEIEMQVGKKQEIEMTFEPENTTIDYNEIKYASSDSKVAIVDSDGKINAISPGTATITITYGNITTSTNITVKGDDTTSTQESSSNFKSCLITAIVTFILTILFTTIRGLIKTRKELTKDDDDDETLNKYI